MDFVTRTKNNAEVRHTKCALFGEILKGALHLIYESNAIIAAIDSIFDAENSTRSSPACPGSAC